MKQYDIRFGLVMSTNDPQGSGRIKVRLFDGDYGITNENDLKTAYPLLPLQINVMPERGELVYVFASSSDSNFDTPLRYLGPIVSSPTKLDNDSASESLNTMEGSSIQMEPNLVLLKGVKGCFGDSKDVGLYGRKNSDVICGTKALALRHNVRRYSENNAHRVEQDVDTPSAIILNDNSVNVIADKINLIGNRTPNGEVLDREVGNKYITSEDKYDKFTETAHPLPFGDVLCDFLVELTNTFANHKHRMEGESPDADNAYKHLLQTIGTLRENLLSNNIHIN